MRPAVLLLPGGGSVRMEILLAAGAACGWLAWRWGPRLLRTAGSAEECQLEALAAELLCPLSGELLKDPVVAADGETYERARIQEWLFKAHGPDCPHGHETSPVTNERLLHKALVDNKRVRRIVAAFHQARRWADDRDGAAAGRGDGRLVEAEQQVAAEVEGAGSLEEAQALMRAHFPSGAVQQAACRSIRRLVMGNAEQKALAYRIGVLGDLQQAIRAHPHSPDVLRPALGCIVETVYGTNAGDKHEAEGELFLLADIKMVIQRYPGTPGVLQDAFNAALWLSASEPNNKVKAGELDLLADVQHAMQGYPDESGIQVTGCAAIAQMVAGNAANKARAEDLGMVADVQAAGQKHKRNGEVMFWYAKALAVLQ